MAQRRQLQNDASEATVEIPERQLATAEAFDGDEGEYIIAVDAEQPQAHTLLMEHMDARLQTAS